MTVRAGARAKNRQGEPDPGHFERFCREIVPGVLTDVCHVDEELAAQVSKDILARAESYAALDDTVRGVLISPFAEEVVGYGPADSSLELKGAVSVIAAEAAAVSLDTYRAAVVMNSPTAGPRRRRVRPLGPMPAAGSSCKLPVPR